jgi:hypothetical protein
VSLCLHCTTEPVPAKNLAFCSRACSAAARRKPLRERVLLKLNRIRGHPDQCWPWWKGTNYGTIRDGQGGLVGAHRAVWAVLNGPIPECLDVLHRCDNPPCCNPGHLFLGTHSDNMTDMSRKGRGAPPLLLGAANPNTVYSDQIVDELRSRAAEGTGMTHSELARWFGMSVAHARRIRLGESRKPELERT